MPNYQKVLGGRPLVFLFGGKADPSDLYVAVALLPPREVQGYAYICVWLCVYTFIYIFMHAAPRQCYTALQTILLSGLSLSRSPALPLSRSLVLFTTSLMGVVIPLVPCLNTLRLLYWDLKGRRCVLPPRRLLVLNHTLPQ